MGQNNLGLNDLTAGKSRNILKGSGKKRFTVSIHVYMTVEEKEKLISRAEQEDIKASVMIRKLLKKMEYI